MQARQVCLNRSEVRGECRRTDVHTCKQWLHFAPDEMKRNCGGFRGRGVQCLLSGAAVIGMLWGRSGHLQGKAEYSRAEVTNRSEVALAEATGMG